MFIERFAFEIFKKYDNVAFTFSVYLQLNILTRHKL
jgi:hypothetical protein